MAESLVSTKSNSQQTVDKLSRFVDITHFD